MAKELPATNEAPMLSRCAVATLPETCRPTPVIIDAGTRAMYVGPSFTLGRHRNAVAVLAVGVDAPFAMGTREDRRDGGTQRLRLIPPGAWHWLDARGGTMAFLYLDAADPAWPALAGADDGVDATLLAALAAFRTGASSPTATWRTVSLILRSAPVAAAPPGVAEAMAAVRADPSKRHAASTHAARSGCALSTFQRRFSAHAGLPWRRWRQWQRLRHAAQAICHGSDLTAAAHAAGFASGSHFSDAFRATFGLAPMRLVAWRVRWCAVAP